MTPRLANLLTVALLLGLYATLSVTAPRWAQGFRETVGPDEHATPEAADRPAASREPSDEARTTISVKLFFEARDRHGLLLEERTVPFSPDLSRQIRSVVEELIRGSQTGLIAPLNRATRVLEVFVSARGVAYVDLSKEAAEGHPGGTDAELMAVYAVVNTLTENFPAIRRVQILVEDRQADTFSGHVDLSRPLPPDLTLLAAAELSPIEVPGESAPLPTPSPPS